MCRGWQHLSGCGHLGIYRQQIVLTKREMRNRLTSRLLALALILCVGTLAVQTAGHWHGHESDEQHCQVCHVGHIAVPQPVAQIAVLAPAPISRFSAPQESAAHFEVVATHRIPRAPPV
jgi:hypothetical protein